MKKLLVFGLFLILLCSFASAAVDLSEGSLHVYRMENTSFIDDIWSANGVNNGVSIVAGKNNNAGNFTSSEVDYVEVDNISSNLTGLNVGTVNLWWKPKSVGGNYQMFSLSANANERFEFWQDSTPSSYPLRLYIKDAGVVQVDQSIGKLSSTSQWYMITIKSNGTHIEVFQNATSLINISSTYWWNDITSGAAEIGARAYDHASQANGFIDEVYFWNRALSQSEITELWNTSSGTFYPFPIPPDNASTEKTFIFEQLGGTSINSANFVTIMNSTFNITNIGQAYFGYRLTVDSSTSSKMECRILVDNNSFESEINRSTSPSTGTMYVITEPTTNLSVGEHSSALQCRRLGGGNINVENIYGVGHYLIDENNQTINNNHIHLENITVNSASFVSVGNVSLVGSNINLTNFNRTMIFNWAEELIYTEDSEGVTLIRVNGTNCSSYPRFGNTGVSGNIGGDCVINNVKANENITFEILFKGNSTINHFHGVVKEFILESDELISGDLTGINITNSNLTKIINFTVVNSEHPSHGFFVKAGIPILSNAATTDSSFQFRLTGTKSENGTIYDQVAIQTNNSVAIIQYIFQNLSIGTYQVELWAQCDNANCTINGGDLVGYVTDTEEAEPAAIEVRAFDIFDNSNILNFSVSVEGGLNFSTTSGVVNVFSENALTNLSIISGFNGGYFGNVTLNHNMSNDLNVTLKQTIIKWNCLEKVSFTDLTCSSPLESTEFNYNVIGNPHSQFLNVSGYFDNNITFNVSALQNQTLNATFYSTNLTINSTGNLGSPSSCTYNITGITYPSYSESISGTPSGFVGLINGTYSVLADCDGYAFNTQNITINLTQQSLNFSLLTTNSFNITFRNAVTNALLTGVNISVEFIGASSFTNYTNTSNLYVDLISPSEYTIVFDADGYRQNQYIIDLDDRGSVNLTLYMDLDNLTNLVLINVKDTFGNVIKGGDVTIQRYGNNAWFTEQIRRTDFQGRTEGYFVLSTVFYNFLVEYQGTTFFGTINSNEDKKQIYAEDVANGITIIINTATDETINNYQSLYGVTVTPISFVNTSNTSAYFRFAWDDSDNIPRNGTLRVYRDGVLNCTNNASTEAGTLFCFFNETSNALWTAVGFIDGEAVDSYSQRFGPNDDLFKDWGAFGYALAFFLVMICFFVFLENPTISIYAGSGAFAASIIFGVIFKDFNLAGISLLIVLSAFVASITSKQGVNT